MDTIKGDFIFQSFAFAPLILPLLLFIFIIIFVMKIVRRFERRAEERLKLDKENSSLQEQQIKAINELNERLTKIENLLKEVD
ncbi:hypothetical protein V7128_24235 [Neobacillus vireti]|uniref:hypothetical protein n=1 Tax=Neobacillus vireti TaxID=220686 RepID=UPI002FFE3A67